MEHTRAWERLRRAAWWPRSGRQRAAEAIATGATADQRRTLAERLALWHVLSLAEREALEGVTVGFLATKEIEAANGFEVTADMALLLAAQAAVPLVGVAMEHGPSHALDHYSDVRSVVVHPSTVVLSGSRPTVVPQVVTDDAQHLLGQAQLHGPVLLAWDEVEAGLRQPGRGRNVVFHEFAHKLDMRDGRVNGTPLLGDAEVRQRWHDLATRELALLRQRPDPVLRRYGAQNPAEFFAVVVEAFLDEPLGLAHAKPDLYAVLRDLFQQDPAARVARLLPATI